MRHHIAGQVERPDAVDERVLEEYLRCYRDPATIHASCEDYRASAGIDLRHDAEDGDRRLPMPLLALWGSHGTVGALYDVLQTWRERALDVSGQALNCKHSPQEECPDELLTALTNFL